VHNVSSQIKTSLETPIAELFGKWPETFFTDLAEKFTKSIETEVESTINVVNHVLTNENHVREFKLAVEQEVRDSTYSQLKNLREQFGEHLKPKFSERFQNNLDKLTGIEIGERYNSLFTLLVEIYAKNSKFELPYVFGQAEDFEETKESGPQFDFDRTRLEEFEAHAQELLKAAIVEYVKKRPMSLTKKILIGVGCAGTIAGAIAVAPLAIGAATASATIAGIEIVTIGAWSAVTGGVVAGSTKVTDVIQTNAEVKETLKQNNLTTIKDDGSTVSIVTLNDVIPA